MSAAKRAEKVGRNRAPVFVLLCGMFACGRLGYDPLDPELLPETDAGAGADGQQGAAFGGGIPSMGGLAAGGDGMGGLPMTGGTVIGGAGGTPLAGGATMGGTTMGGATMGGVTMGGVTMGGSTMGGTAAGGSTGQVPATYQGQWVGNVRGGPTEYSLEVDLADGIVGTLIGTFYIPAYECGGVARLKTVGATLVYDETLLFGTLASCIGAGTAMLTPSSGNQSYEWTITGTNERHRGTLARRPSSGSLVPSGMKGLWGGMLSQLNPGATRETYIVVSDGAVGNVVAHVIYPSMGNWCGGPLVLTSAGANTLSVDEVLSDVGRGCPTNGKIALTLVGGALQVAWSRTGSNTTATGTLQRP